MRIKKFKIYYGGHGSSHTHIFKKGKDVFYYSGYMPLESYGRTIPAEAIRVRPDKRQWHAFLETLKPFASTWKKEYFGPVVDGIQWEVKIIMHDVTFKSHGSNAFPEDFEEFLELVTMFLGVKGLVREV
jgi:hypothetical protein